MNLIEKILLESELDDQDEFDINLIFQPNERAKQELERRKKEFKENLKKIELGLEKVNKAFENKEWESEEELFLELFYKSKTKVDLEKYPTDIFIIKNNKRIAYQDFKNKYFWIDYYLTWKVVGNEFNGNSDEIQSFMESMLNKYFKLRDYIVNFARII